MGDGEWRMANGEWRMADGGWQIANAFLLQFYRTLSAFICGANYRNG